MSDTPEYMLAKPIEVWKEGDKYCSFLFDDLSDDPGYRTFDQEYFDEHFVLLDVQALEKQLAEILCDIFVETGVLNDGTETYRKHLDDVETDFRPYMKSKVADIKALFGLHNTEET